MVLMMVVVEVEEYDSEKEQESQINPNDLLLPSKPHSSNSSKTFDDMREQDSDSLDPVEEDHSNSYDKLGEIIPTIRVSGQGKNYYGVGKKPTTVSEAKARGKTNTKFPQPGDIGELNIQ